MNNPNFKGNEFVTFKSQAGLRSRTTIEFFGLWEQLNNPDFKGVEFDTFLFEDGSNSFTMFQAIA